MVFIRYNDPDWHLRLRFPGEPALCRPELQS
ncbi:lantibiotic dehydratase C-terminal domain-containing protein [Rheinheimera riviphila]